MPDKRLAPTLDWNKVWDEVDSWYQAACSKKRCKTCGHTDLDYPEWDDQQRAIERTVNKHVKKLLQTKP